MKTRITAPLLLTGLALSAAMSTAHSAEAEGRPYRQADAEALLAADRAFAEVARAKDASAALADLFAANVIFTTEDGKLFRGKEAAIAAIAADLVGAKIHWQPVRGGISADGQHGFSYGFMAAIGPDGATKPLKYLAYWIRHPEGWRVAGFKYARRPQGNTPTATMKPLLPKHAATFDPEGENRHAESLAAAEKGFSDEAQIIGLSAAFARHGGPESMNMGRTASFTIGSQNIGRELFGAPQAGSPIEWSSDGVLVASSGDLGVSWGAIRVKNATPPQSFAFFTIWRRDSADDPWRYIAE
ncbi:DUF4440 domain-containing protein [Sphingomonas cavernae]|uniref:Nuclear transport factor 2 family protein n=1 Tax=Sphingomonas cavernae TaxID=2320861 RepID=A0A418W625_9SPHN|nr:DUF4440 domain-containing protein [Sphingomonas cavernae]RJF85398.1 nuclear transport factor 2 family protein [Sphingomonas cavernae]